MGVHFSIEHTTIIRTYNHYLSPIIVIIINPAMLKNMSPNKLVKKR